VNINELSRILKKALSSGINVPDIPQEMEGFIYSQSLQSLVSTNPSIKNELLDFFANNKELSIFDNKIFNQGGYCRSIVQYHTLLKWLLYKTHEVGIDEAVSSLDKYLHSDGNPVIQVLAISGLEVDDTVDLSHGIQLTPFSALPNSMQKDMLDPPFLRSDKLATMGLQSGVLNLPERVVYARPSAALVRKITLSPKSYVLDAEVADNTDSSKLLYESCECLTCPLNLLG